MDVGLRRGQGTTCEEFCKLEVPFPDSSCRLKTTKSAKKIMGSEALLAGK